MPAQSRTFSVTIAAPADRVYAFASDPRHLPAWAPGLCTAVRPDGDGWIVTTPHGDLALHFAPRNDYGVLDHVVTVAPGVNVVVPMRVVANGDGAEVIFTLFRMPGMDDGRWAADAALVDADLRRLQRMCEDRFG